jgi:hypothetical protein
MLAFEDAFRGNGFIDQSLDCRNFVTDEIILLPGDLRLGGIEQ